MGPNVVTGYASPSHTNNSTTTTTHALVSNGASQVHRNISEDLTKSQRVRDQLVQENANIHARLVDLQSRNEAQQRIMDETKINI